MQFARRHHAPWIAGVALFALTGVNAFANPTGAQVTNGTVTIQQPSAGTLQITNSPGSVINWQGFSIGQQELTRFIQQSSSSAVLNRVVGGNISQIQGQLLSNGRVFLINPSGIVIGPGAVVDTAGFVGSTLNMLDADFLAGKLKFQGDSSSGSIINQGWIRTGYGGQVILVAPQIENSGLIHTPGGELLLAAGQKLTITSLDLEGVQFEVQAPTDSVLNVGKLLADGGAVGVFAGTLKHSGEIRANALVQDQAGRIVLKAQDELQIAAGSTTAADGKIGGSVTIQSDNGLARVAGQVSAKGSAGPGGNIQVLGDRVAVVEKASLDTSGSTGGGQILVGGDYQGANVAVKNASSTFVGSDATLRADGTQAGDGGRIIVWSDNQTQFYGNLSARGGADSGNGGFAEVSGKKDLIFAGSADLGAPHGSMGTLLLDPLDLFVFANPVSGGLDPSIIDEAADFPSNAATVSPGTLAAINGNVSLYASRYMRISDPITLTTAGQGLTATVGTYTAPALPDPLALSTSVPNRMDLAANITTAGGAVSLTAPTIQGVAASTIQSNGGAISLSASATNTVAQSIQASLLSLDAGSGAVTATPGTTAGSFLQLGAVSGGTFSATAPSFISTGAITTAGGAVTLNSTSSSIFTGAITTAGGAVTLGAPSSSVNTGNISAGAAAVTLSGTSVSANTIDTTGAVNLTATRGSIGATVNNAGSVTANATNSTSGSSVSLSSTTVLNATDVRATTTQCSTNGFCSGAFVSLSGDQGVNVGTVVASAPTNTTITSNLGAAYEDPRFENRSESVNIFSSAGSIRAMSGSSSITATDVSLSTGLLSGGGIGQTALPLNVNVSRTFTFQPNGEFNVQLTGSGPNQLGMQIGVAPTGQTYSGALAKTGQIALNTSVTDTTVTTSTFDISSGFDQRVFNASPRITLDVPNGSLSAGAVKVPAGDVTGTISPTAKHNCDIGVTGACPPAVTIEPLPVLLEASNDLSVTSYTRAVGSVAKNSTFISDDGSVTLGTVSANRDPISVQAFVDATIQTGLTTLGSTSISAFTGNATINNLQAAGQVDITANGNVTINGLDTSAGPGAVNITAGGVVGAPSGSDTEAAEIIAGTNSVSVNAGTIGNSANAHPLDIIAGSVSLTAGTGGIGFAGAPVSAVTRNLTIDSGGKFNVTTDVSTGAVDIQNLNVTASPSGVGTVGADRARVTSNGKIYDFVSDGTNFTLGGTNFAGGSVPATQFTNGSLSFTATTGDLTLNSVNLSASNANFSATTNGNLANITQTPSNPIDLGKGVLTLQADGAVTLEGVNAGGMSVANATSVVGSGCSGSFGPCGVTSFTANQTLTDTANGGGTWSVTSRGAITTGALQVAGVNFTTNGSGSIVTGAIEADNVTLHGSGSVTVGAGTLPTDQAVPIINAARTGAASINLQSDTSSVTVNGAMNAATVSLTSPTAINTGDINPAAPSPGTISLNATSGGTVMNTGSLDAKTIQFQGICLFCAPGNITINGAIGGGLTKPTLVSIFANSSNSVVIAGNVTLDPTAPGSVFIGAGTTLTGTAGAALGAVTAGDGSNIDLRANNTNTATPFQFTRIDSGATGTVTVTAPAGIKQTTNGPSDGITAATVALEATASGSRIEGPASTTTLPLALRETSDLTLNAGGIINVARSGAGGVPLLTNLDVTRSDSTAGVSLGAFASGQSVTVTNVSGGVEIGLSNTSATPLNIAYRNSDGVNGNLTGTGITTKGGSVSLNTTQNLTTGAIDTQSGVATPPDGSISLRAGQTLNVSGTVDSGGGAIFAQGTDITGTGQLVSTNNAFVEAFSGNIGSGATPLGVSAPSVSLEAFGTNPSGNIFAALTGTTDLTMNANDGFTVSSTTPLASLDLTTRGDGIGPVSLTTTGAQSFGFARNGTAVEITPGITSTTPLSSVSINVNSGDLKAKGSIAADSLTLDASGILTLDGSSSALTLSNVNQNLFGSGGLVIQGNVTANATTSQTLSTFGNLNFTGTGVLSSGNFQNISAFGNLDFVAQSGAISVQSVNQSISGFGGGSVMTLQGGAGAGQSVTFTGSSSQTIQTPDTTTSSIRLLGGTTGTDASASIIYTGSGTQTVQGGSIVMTGGGASGASALISTATGSQLVRANTDIKLTGGTASGAVAKIENTSTNQQKVGESEFIPFCCSQPYQTDNVIVQGGNGAEAAIVAAGLQKIQADQGVKVLGGSGSGGSARIENTSVTADQRIGCNSGSPAFESCANTLNTLDLIAGASGASAQIIAAGTQRLLGFSNMTVTGDATDGGIARISTTGSSQFVQFFGAANVIQAGAGNGSNAEIVSAGTQNLQFGNLALTGGGSAGGNTAVARIAAAGAQSVSAGTASLTGGAGPNSVAQITSAGNQSLGFSSLSLAGGANAGSYAKIDAGGTQSLSSGNITLSAGTAPGTSAIVTGNSQSVFGSAVTLTGGTGTSGSTSDAEILNLSGNQSISASSITLSGGTDFSTTAILNQGTDAQTISASGGVTLASNSASTAAAPVQILNAPATLQTLNVGRLDVLTNGAGAATVSSGGDQKIHTNNGSPALSLSVAALGSGTASIEAAGAQLIEVDYPALMQGGTLNGVLSVGESGAVGNSLVQATDQTVVAGSIVIQAGSGAGSTSKLSATNNQVVSTLLGGIDVLGGAGTDSLATVDPVSQTIVSNGTINLAGGSGSNADASIVSTGLQTLLATSGDITLTGGTGPNADAFITFGLPQTISTTGSIILTLGSGTNALAFISNPGSTTTAPFSCTSCTLLAVTPTSVLGSAAIFDTTSLILPWQDNLTGLLAAAAVGEEITDYTLTGRAPVCR